MFEKFEKINQVFTEWLRILIWPIIFVFFLTSYQDDIKKLINRSTLNKISLGGIADIEITNKKIETLKNSINENNAKKVLPEDTYNIIKTIKDFQEAINSGDMSKLPNFFSERFKNRDLAISEWSKLLNNNLIIYVKEVSTDGFKFFTSIVYKFTSKNKLNEWEDTAILIKENKKWKILE